MPIDFKGVKVQALQYRSFSNPDSAAVLFFRNGDEYALKVKINDGKEELLIYQNPNEYYWKNEYNKALALLASPAYRSLPAKDESILFPVLDFNFVKERHSYS